MPDLILETERLLLRRPKRHDAQALADAIGHPDINATTLGIPFPYSLDDALSWIDRQDDPDVQAVQVNLNFFISDTDELIGGAGLSSINEKHHRAELGYWCAVGHWGKGFTTEAAERILRYGFEELALERIYAICFASNPASARVMEKNGMTFEGTAYHEFMKNDKFIDMHHYAILRSDWLKQ